MYITHISLLFHSCGGNKVSRKMWLCFFLHAVSSFQGNIMRIFIIITYRFFNLKFLFGPDPVIGTEVYIVIV